VLRSDWVSVLPLAQGVRTADSLYAPQGATAQNQGRASMQAAEALLHPKPNFLESVKAYILFCG